MGQNLSFSRKERGTKEGVNPLIYVIKTWEYKSSLRRLIYKLRISFTNKNIRKKFKVLVAFLSSQKIGGQLGFLPRSFFLKIVRSKLWESHLAKKKIYKFHFNYSSAKSQNQSMHWFVGFVEICWGSFQSRDLSWGKNFH